MNYKAIFIFLTTLLLTSTGYTNLNVPAIYLNHFVKGSAIQQAFSNSDNEDLQIALEQFARFHRHYNSDLSKFADHLIVSCDKGGLTFIVGGSNGVCAAFIIDNNNNVRLRSLRAWEINAGAVGKYESKESGYLEIDSSTFVLSGETELRDVTGYYLAAKSTVVADLTWGMMKLDGNPTGSYLDGQGGSRGLGAIYGSLLRLYPSDDAITYLSFELRQD